MTTSVKPGGTPIRFGICDALELYLARIVSSISAIGWRRDADAVACRAGPLGI